MAIMELVLTYTYQGQECQNRWNYVAAGSLAGYTNSTALAEAFGLIPTGEPLAYPADTVFEAIRNIQVPGVDYVGFSILNVYDLADFYAGVFTTPAVGLYAAGGETMSPAVAVGFRTTRTTRAVRRATKRFAGLSENMFSNGGSIAAGLLDEVLAISLKMTEIIEKRSGPTAITFTPAVCGKERYPTNEEETKFAYRYFPTEAEQLEHTMTGIEWDVYTQMRTQRSRQYGRGR